MRRIQAPTPGPKFDVDSPMAHWDPQDRKSKKSKARCSTESQVLACADEPLQDSNFDSEVIDVRPGTEDGRLRSVCDSSDVLSVHLPEETNGEKEKSLARSRSSKFSEAGKAWKGSETPGSSCGLCLGGAEPLPQGLQRGGSRGSPPPAPLDTPNDCQTWEQIPNSVWLGFAVNISSLAHVSCRQNCRKFKAVKLSTRCLELNLETLDDPPLRSVLKE